MISYFLPQLSGLTPKPLENVTLTVTGLPPRYQAYCLIQRRRYPHTLLWRIRLFFNPRLDVHISFHESLTYLNTYLRATWEQWDRVAMFRLETCKPEDPEHDMPPPYGYHEEVDAVAAEEESAQEYTQ